jgi:hypothetical protein
MCMLYRIDVIEPSAETNEQPAEPADSSVSVDVENLILEPEPASAEATNYELLV